MTELLRRDQANMAGHFYSCAAIGAGPLAPDKIDKSALAIAEPKRIRNKAHLKFVASQPCLGLRTATIRSTSFAFCAATSDRPQSQ